MQYLLLQAHHILLSLKLWNWICVLSWGAFCLLSVCICVRTGHHYAYLEIWMLTVLIHMLQQRLEVPPNFRRLLSSRLRRLVSQGKLEKVIMMLWLSNLPSWLMVSPFFIIIWSMLNMMTNCFQWIIFCLSLDTECFHVGIFPW